MSTRRQPRQSALSGGHPAIPAESRAALAPEAATPERPERPTTTVTPLTVPLPAKPAKAATTSQKMTVNINRELAEQAKDAFWLARGEYRTFSAWIEDALRHHIEATKHVHGVDDVPARPGGSLPTGRPLG